MKEEIAEWLSVPGLNVFATVTLKQALPNDYGTLSRLTPEKAVSTAWFLRDRVTNAVVGKGKKKLPFLVFAEGDGSAKRFHLHVVTQMPDDMEFDAYCERFRRAALQLDWVHREIDIRPIEPGSIDRVISYSLKEGIGAFKPEASHIPA